MTFKTFAMAGCAAALAFAPAVPAFAQAPAPTQTNTPQVNHGPPPPGVCIISVEGAVGGSAVGRHVQTRLQQLAQQANAELQAEQTGIQNESKTLESQRATLDRTAMEQRLASLQVRANALERKAQQRQQELAATEQKAFARIGQEMEPLIRQAYQAKNCSVLLNRNAIVISNPALDITPQVVTALNAKITQFAFDRERLDTPAPAGGQPQR